MSHCSKSSGSHDLSSSSISKPSGHQSSSLSLSSFSDQKILSSVTYHRSSSNSTSGSTRESTGVPFVDPMTKTYDATDYLKEGESYISPNFHIQTLQENIQKSLTGHVVIYPKSMERFLSQKNSDVIKRLESAFPEGAFVLGGFSLLMTLNVAYKRSLPDVLLYDICLFARNRPVYILSIARKEQENNLDTYNSRLCQTIITYMRKEIVNFKPVNGVVSLDTLLSSNSFEKRLEEIAAVSTLSHSPASVYLDSYTCKSGIWRLLKLVALSSSPEMSGDDPERELYFVEGAFQLLIEIFETRAAVVVTATSAEFLRFLVSEVATRLTKSGETKIVATSPEYIPYLKTVTFSHLKDLKIEKVDARVNQSLRLERDDVCISSKWTGESHWIFTKKNPKEHVRRPAYSDVLKGDIKPSTLGTHKSVEAHHDDRVYDISQSDNRGKLATGVVKSFLANRQITDTTLNSKLTEIVAYNLQQSEKRSILFLNEAIKSGIQQSDIDKQNVFLEEYLMSSYRQKLPQLGNQADVKDHLDSTDVTRKTRQSKTLCSFCTMKRSLGPLTEDLIEVDKISASLRRGITEESIPHAARWSLLFKAVKRVQETVATVDNSSQHCLCGTKECRNQERSSSPADTDIARLQDVASETS